MKERYETNHSISLERNETVRPFASGSRQTPDPFDSYLDENGFYRKHTARDSSCLFRVISEQIYDIQNYHERVREECVTFMKENSKLFEKEQRVMNEDFDNYLLDMSKPKGRGSHLELKAAGLLYEANVLLFEPYTRGKYLFKPRKNFKRILRVFYTAPSHFDSVYTKNFIEKAAFCQAIVYEILYEKVFQLPDIKYAVERMLYDPAGTTMVEEETHDGTKAIAEDGREFEFDKADDTKCVLGDYKLCHFHNAEGFNEEIMKVKERKDKEESLIKREIMPNILQMDYFLYDSKISCVRQLLNASIAPLPYKVAKALDTSIYRNIEFDSWADFRRESRFKNCFGYGNQLMVGYKCILSQFGKSGEFYNICILKEISKDKRDCLVFVPDTGESIFVPYASLKPITKTNNYSKVEESYNVRSLSRRFISYNNKNNQLSIKSYKQQKTSFKRDKFSSLDKCEFEIDGIREEIMARQMMFNKNAVNTEPINGKELQKPVLLKAKEKESFSNSDETPNITFLQDADSVNKSQDLQKFLQPANYGPVSKVAPFEAKPLERSNADLHIRNTKINYAATKSEKLDGSDLPTDIATLRYFFNAGIDSFKSSKTYNHITMQISNVVETNTPVTPSHMTDIVNSFENLKTDDNNNNNNTPTTGPLSTLLRSSSSNYGNNNGYQGNNQDYNNRRGTKRRPFGNGSSNSGRGHHNNNYHGNHRNYLSYQNSRHGSNYHQGTPDYNRGGNQNHDGSLKGSTTPVSVGGQHSSVCHDSGVLSDTQNSIASEYQHPNVIADYSTVNALNVNIQQTQQYPYAANMTPQPEYDHNNYYVQTPVSCYYPQPGSVPNTPQLMIPAAEMNSYMYNPTSAPIDSNGSQMVEPFVQYMQPYFYSAPVQAPPMGYFTYYPTTPMGYGNVGPATATSPSLAPTMSNAQQQ